MPTLGWSWLAAPYIVCSTVILAVALAGALVRGDRVLRLGVIGAAMSALPWAVTHGVAACTTDPLLASRLLRLGQGPVALVGPNLLLVLLGVSGQLERYRWTARIAGMIGTSFLLACWATDWIVPGVQLLPVGMFYITPGPLTGVHVSQLVIWLAVGLVIARRASPEGEGRRTLRVVLLVLVLGAIGSLDALLLYQRWGAYPIAWLPATLAAALSLYLVLRTDLVRPQGFDRAVAVELVVSAVAFGAIALIVSLMGPSLASVAGGAVAWASLTAIAWAIAAARPVSVTGERELHQFVARVALLDDEVKIAERLKTLFQTTIGLDVRAVWWRDRDAFVSVAGGTRWVLEPEIEAWLAHHGEALALTDLATMKVGAIRDRLVALGRERKVAVLIPLTDREELVGVVEGDHDRALRDSDRGVIGDAARAAARALTFAGLARAAARERDTAREVEVADALRLQASASRDAELGAWAVAAEYRTAPRTSGAGWSAIELADGRLALLATEAQAHGVAAALATAALTGAFAAATTGTVAVTLEDLIGALRASSEGVVRGGEPVAAFLAILDARAGTIEYACAGHPGAALIGPIATIDSGLPFGSTKGPRPRATLLGAGTGDPAASLSEARRHSAALPPDTLLVVASSQLRGPDDERWRTHLQELAPASGRLASVLVEIALRGGEPDEDLLAVVVRAR